MIRRRKSIRKRRPPSHPVTLETKWGWEPYMEHGWCAVPAALLRFAGGLGITAEEGWLLVQLLDLKWSEGRTTLQSLTERCGFSQKQIHEMLASLQSRGFLKLNPRTPANRAARFDAPPLESEDPARLLAGWEIDLSPLLRALTEYIMRGGDLSAGFLRLSSVKQDKNNRRS